MFIQSYFLYFEEGGPWGGSWGPWGGSRFFIWVYGYLQRLYRPQRGFKIKGVQSIHERISLPAKVAQVSERFLQVLNGSLIGFQASWREFNVSPMSQWCCEGSRGPWRCSRSSEKGSVYVTEVWRVLDRRPRCLDYVWVGDQERFQRSWKCFKISFMDSDLASGVPEGA